MSWGVQATSGSLTTATDRVAAAAAAAAARTDSATFDASEVPPLCFACSRCEYPICTSSDILLSKVPGGTSEYAFQYNLDYLLDLDEGVSVPCYCGDETVDTAILVSEKMLEEPMPPIAKVMCMESIVESRKFLRAQQSATLAKLMHQQKQPSDESVPALAAATAEQQDALPPPPLRQSQQQTAGRLASLTSATEPALGPEHDLQLAESIPEGGDAAERTSPAAPPSNIPATAAAAEDDVVEEEEGETVSRQNFQQQQQTERQMRAAHAERIHHLLSESRVLRPVRRYGATSEARVDMVCVSSDVLGYGLSISTRDRSAAAIPAQTGTEASTKAGSESRESAISRLPQNIIDAASQAPPKTAWGPPGNLTVEEGFLIVTRATSSAQGQWFSEYVCEDRVECPDCHLPLGFIFERKAKASPGSTSATKKMVEKSEEDNDAELAGGPANTAPVQEDAGEDEEAGEHDDGNVDTMIQRSFQLPPGRVPVFASLESARTREQQVLAAQNEADEDGTVEITDGSVQESVNEGSRRPRSEDAQAGSRDASVDNHAADGQRREEQSKRAKVELSSTASAQTGPDAAVGKDGNNSLKEASDAFPDVFIGLELKRIKQIEWGLCEFQQRYAKAQSLRSFRAMFPEAEELQSLYNRLSALRTQSELYNNLLRKHKEQSDVHNSLLHSQKDRLSTYEERFLTMQQLIEAQKTQLGIQDTQIKKQDELMRTQRKKVAAQAQQIEMGQLLVSEQAKTIEAQREQIRLMRAHLDVRKATEKTSASGTGDPASKVGSSQSRPVASEAEEEERRPKPSASPSDGRLAPKLHSSNSFTPPTTTTAALSERYEDSVKHTRELLTEARRVLAERTLPLAERLALAERSIPASPSPSSASSSLEETASSFRRSRLAAVPPSSSILPPMHLRGVCGTPAPSPPSPPLPSRHEQEEATREQEEDV